MANFYNSHRAEPSFTYLKKDEKTIEAQVKTGKYQAIKKGDHLMVYNKTETDTIELKVLRVTSYESFQELLEIEPLKQVLPDAETIEEAVEIYTKFYTPADEKKFGVVAIEVKRV